MTAVFEPHNILVTGGCGFMGSDFVRYLAREHPGVRVAVLDKQVGGRPAARGGAQAWRALPSREHGRGL